MIGKKNKNQLKIAILILLSFIVFLIICRLININSTVIIITALIPAILLALYAMSISESIFSEIDDKAASYFNEIRSGLNVDRNKSFKTYMKKLLDLNDNEVFDDSYKKYVINSFVQKMSSVIIIFIASFFVIYFGNFVKTSSEYVLVNKDNIAQLITYFLILLFPYMQVRYSYKIDLDYRKKAFYIHKQYLIKIKEKNSTMLDENQPREGESNTKHSVDNADQIGKKSKIKVTKQARNNTKK